MGTEEAILAKQRYFQSVHKLTHLKGAGDKFTSTAIPLALVGIGALMMEGEILWSGQGLLLANQARTPKMMTNVYSGFLFLTSMMAFGLPLVALLPISWAASVGRGLNHLYHSTGKKEGA